MNSAYDRDPEYKIQITTEDNLKIHLGVSAVADLIFNFNSNNNNQK